MDLYAENILDHFRHPHRKEVPSRVDAQHQEKNLACGDHVTAYLTLDGNCIADIGWMGEGCAISQASMSMLADELQGKTLEEVDAWTRERVLEMLGVPVGERRLKCALLGLLAVRNAVRVVRGEQPLSWIDVVNP